MERFPKFLDNLDGYFFACRVVCAGQPRAATQILLIVFSMTPSGSPASAGLGRSFSGGLEIGPDKPHKPPCPCPRIASRAPVFEQDKAR